MARTVKAGIPYFSHDVDMINDRKVRLLKATHGLIGYAIYIRLLEELYRDHGYYLHVNEEFNMLFCDDNNIDLNVYINVLNDCINRSLFDIFKFNDYNILTSERIQKNYFDATQRRKEVTFVNQYMLFEPLDYYNSEKVNVYIKELNVDINKKNADIGTQSKVKKSKEKKSIVNIGDKSPKFKPPIFQEVLDYCEERNNIVDPQAFIDFYESKGWMIGKNKMKSWKAAVRTWEKNRSTKKTYGKPDMIEEISSWMNGGNDG